MSITLLTGVPGSGKTTRLIELVQDAERAGRSAATYFCSDAPALAANEAVSLHGVLASRQPGVVQRLDHLVRTLECGALLEREPPGALVAFEECQWFGPEIVPLWVDASRRGVDVVAATPSRAQLRMLTELGHGFVEQRLEARCSRCGERPASDFVPDPHGRDVISVCGRCRRALQLGVWSSLRGRLRRLEAPAAVEVLGLHAGRGAPRSERARWRELQDAVRGPGFRREGRALVLGCGTGFVCHRLRRWGYKPVIGVDEDPEHVEIARLVDGYFHGDSNTYLQLGYEDYLRAAGPFDLVVVTDRCTTAAAARPTLAALIEALTAEAPVFVEEAKRFARLEVAAPVADDSPAINPCAVCEERPATSEPPALGTRTGREQVPLCSRCRRRRRPRAWWELRRLIAPLDPPERLELPGLRGGRAQRHQAEERWETLELLVRGAGLPLLGRRLSALVVGCGAGELCIRLHGWGLAPVLGLDEDARRIAAARLAEGYFRPGAGSYLACDYESELAALAAEERFDVVVATAAALRDGQRRARLVELVAGVTAGLCVIEAPPDGREELAGLLAAAGLGVSTVQRAEATYLAGTAPGTAAAGPAPLDGLCAVCRRRPPVATLPDPRARAAPPTAVCEHCRRRLRPLAALALWRRVRALGREPTAIADDRWRTLELLIRSAGLPDEGRRLSALVLGCGTGNLCRRLYRWGLSPVVGVEEDAERVIAGQLASGYVRRDSTALLRARYDDYLHAPVPEEFDVVHASARFVEALPTEQRRPMLVLAARRAAGLLAVEAPPDVAGDVRDALADAGLAGIVTFDGVVAGLARGDWRSRLPTHAVHGPCHVCRRKSARHFLPDPRRGERDTIGLCDRCRDRLRTRAWLALKSQSRRVPPEQPFEVTGLRRARTPVRELERRWQLLQALVGASALPTRGRRLSALVLGCGTGFLCHRLDAWGLSPVVGVDEDAGQVRSGRLAAGYLHRDATSLLHADYERYLATAVPGEFDLVVAAAPFTRRSDRVADAAALAAGLCVVEVEPSGAERLRSTLLEHGGFAKVVHLDGGSTGLVAGARGPLDKRETRELDRLGYRALVERVRALARAHLPEDAQVVVASHGDDELLRLESRRTMHFPRDGDGTYSGRLSGGIEAVEQLERLRRDGATHLVLPATQLWWLEHYGELTEYLARAANLVRHDPETGALYELAPAAADS